MASSSSADDHEGRLRPTRARVHRTRTCVHGTRVRVHPTHARVWHLTCACTRVRVRVRARLTRALIHLARARAYLTRGLRSVSLAPASILLAHALTQAAEASWSQVRFSTTCRLGQAARCMFVHWYVILRCFKPY